ncbi:MOSC domain-containing protein [Virgibacillus halophilus]|uniref:MOSC domain-containing protein n=1 Tax=Tigheibacillus halophilus TaxID=361280 RepID=A0ABU5C9G9_9BACI|nr:MOSC domain-containing protein [Virgibacillus halophilus]
MTSVLIAQKADSFVTEKISSVDLQYGGIPGDLHFGLTKRAGAREPMYKRGTEILNRRQISIVSAEECAIIAEEMDVPKILPEWIGANIVVSGIDHLTKLPAGSRLIFPSGAGILCEGENLPCIHPGHVIQKQYPNKSNLAARFVKAAMGLRGIVGMVEHPGMLHTGDQAKIFIDS